jgi:hypothetical protein
MAAPQQTRVVYNRLPSQSLYPDSWLPSRYRIVFYFIGYSSTFVTHQLHRNLTAASCMYIRAVCVPTRKYSSDLSCMGRRGRYTLWLMIVIQINIGGTSRALHHPLPTSFVLTYSPHYEVLCLIRVYALYGQSRRVLGFLAFTALILFVTGSVCFFPQASGNMHFPKHFSAGCLSRKRSYWVSFNSGFIQFCGVFAVRAASKVCRRFMILLFVPWDDLIFMSTSGRRKFLSYDFPLAVVTL